MHRSTVAAAALLAALAAPHSQAERSTPRPAPLSDDSDRVIVTFKADAAVVRAHALSVTVGSSQARALDARAGALGARHGLSLMAGAAISERTQVVRAAGLTGRALAALLAADPDVAAAEPDRRVRRLAAPNDPRFATVSDPPGPLVGQWYLRPPTGEARSAIDAVTAWDRSQGSAAMIVAVLDTGVRFNHPDLAGKLLPGYDMVDDAAISIRGASESEVLLFDLA